MNISELSIEDLTRLLRQYEESSLQLKAELKLQSHGKEVLNEKISELRKETQRQAQEITRLKDAARFDKAAAEGLVKKNGILAHDLNACRGENKNIKDEKEFYHTKNMQLEQKLNADRSKRLQLLHENELLLQKLNHTTNAKSDTETQFAQAQKELIMKTECLESLTSLKDAQKEFISKQFDDIMNYTGETCDLKAKLFRLAEEIRKKDVLLNEYTMKIRRLEDECHQLRKELFQLQQLTHSRTRNRRQGGMLTIPRNISPVSRAKGANRSSSSSKMLSTDLDSIKKSDTAPIQTLIENTSLGVDKHKHSSNGDTSARLGNSVSKSLFVGSGLGLRNSDFEQYHPKGSAKSILRKVLESLD